MPSSTGTLVFNDQKIQAPDIYAAESLGVGVSDPTSNLQVAGNAYVTSNLEVGTANLIVDTTTGRVGVGTGSPSAPFHVQGARSILGNNSGASDIVINDIPEARWRIATGGHALSFNKHNSSSDEYSTWSEKVRIDQNGNVGIGTNNPSAPLQVNGSTENQFDPIVTLKNSADSGRLTFRDEQSSPYIPPGVWGESGGGLALGTRFTGIKFYASENGATETERMFIKGNGLVGIGTTNPDYPLTINRTTNKSIDGSNYTPYIRMTRNNGHNWTMASNDTDTWNGNLYWFANINDSNAGYPLKQVIIFENDQSKNTVVNNNTFTGQHRNMIKGIPHTQIINFIGLIVSANNNKYLKLNGKVVNNSDAITINEAVPIVELSKEQYDKKCFGVISGSEDPESRTDTYGRVTSIFTREQGDVRTFVNSLGEGAIWVTNINGPLESGDYITTSNVAGYGMKQDSEFLANYTVAKITMDCDFNPPTQPIQQIVKETSNINYYRDTSNVVITENEYNQLSEEQKEEYTLEVRQELVNALDEHGQLQWEDTEETEKAYKIRYLTADGTQTDEANAVHIAAFVGCTYHCG